MWACKTVRTWHSVSWGETTPDSRGLDWSLRGAFWPERLVRTSFPLIIWVIWQVWRLQTVTDGSMNKSKPQNGDRALLADALQFLRIAELLTNNSQKLECCFFIGQPSSKRTEKDLIVLTFVIETEESAYPDFIRSSKVLKFLRTFFTFCNAVLIVWLFLEDTVNA